MSDRCLTSASVQYSAGPAKLRKSAREPHRNIGNFLWSRSLAVTRRAHSSSTYVLAAAECVFIPVLSPLQVGVLFDHFKFFSAAPPSPLVSPSGSQYATLFIVSSLCHCSLVFLMLMVLYQVKLGQTAHFYLFFSPTSSIIVKVLFSIASLKTLCRTQSDLDTATWKLGPIAYSLSFAGSLEP